MDFRASNKALSATLLVREQLHQRAIVGGPQPKRLKRVYAGQTGSARFNSYRNEVVTISRTMRAMIEMMTFAITGERSRVACVEGFADCEKAALGKVATGLPIAAQCLPGAPRRTLQSSPIDELLSGCFPGERSQRSEPFSLSSSTPALAR